MMLQNKPIIQLVKNGIDHRCTIVDGGMVLPYKTPCISPEFADKHFNERRKLFVGKNILPGGLSLAIKYRYVIL